MMEFSELLQRKEHCEKVMAKAMQDFLDQCPVGIGDIKCVVLTDRVSSLDIPGARVGTNGIVERKVVVSVSVEAII